MKKKLPHSLIRILSYYRLLLLVSLLFLTARYDVQATQLRRSHLPVQVYGIIEFSVHEYNNLLLLPRDYFSFGGLGVSKSLMKSGNDFALGALAEGKFGRCLTLDRVYAFNTPFYLTANYGALADPESEQKLGFSVGIGMNFYYSYYISIREEHDSFFRPIFFAQTALNVFNKPVLLRYSSLLTPDKVNQTNFLFGMYLIM